LSGTSLTEFSYFLVIIARFVISWVRLFAVLTGLFLYSSIQFAKVSDINFFPSSICDVCYSCWVFCVWLRAALLICTQCGPSMMHYAHI